MEQAEARAFLFITSTPIFQNGADFLSSDMKKTSSFI